MLQVNGRDLRLRYFDRSGPEQAIVYVHGLGCASDDFLEVTQDSRLRSHRLLSYDMPGCGGSPYDAEHGLDIDSLVTVLEAFVSEIGLRSFLLVGGSMGGLIGLLYAERNPSNLAGFVNVEGNLTPEDCLFSRQVVAHSYDNFKTAVFPKIMKSLTARGNLGFSRHLEVLRRADPRAYYDYCFQLVQYSDSGRLLERFLALNGRKYFVYGSENRHLSYLPKLRAADCRILEVPNANHFPFYDAPVAFASALCECV
jgi:pimeloyl-ACP methyl ester carboxylesterase